MLEVSQLSRSYGDFKAVDDVSFAVGSGEIVGLLGHNGAGKTTVMKMLTGYLEPDEGSVVVAGNALTTHLKKVQREIGYLPENLPVYPEMTVADYLDYAAHLKGIRSANVNAEISRVAGETDLNEKNSRSDCDIVSWLPTTRRRCPGDIGTTAFADIG